LEQRLSFNRPGGGGQMTIGGDGFQVSERGSVPPPMVQ